MQGDTARLSEAGIPFQSVGERIAIAIPGRPFGVRPAERWKLALPALVLSIAIYVAAWLLRIDLTNRVLMTATVAVLAFSMTLLFAHLHFGYRSYVVGVDGAERTVHVPAHAEWDECEFGFDEVRSMSVDWSRLYEQPPRAGAPIHLLSVELWRKMAGIPEMQDHAMLELGGWSDAQSRAFVLWFHDVVAAKRPLGELDPEAAIAAGREWTR